MWTHPSTLSLPAYSPETPGQLPARWRDALFVIVDQGSLPPLTRSQPPEPERLGPVRGLDYHGAGSGSERITGRAAVLNDANGRIAFRFHARDVNLVMGPPKGAASVRFHVFIDGDAVGAAHGSDVDSQGFGTADDQRLYQLIRQPASIQDRTFEIEFLDAGAEAYCFTFG